MRILVDIGHPAHVHFFKHFIWEMERKGHELIVTARNKDVVFPLLKAYSIDYVPVGQMGSGIYSLAREWIGRDIEVYKIVRAFRPHIITGIHNPTVAHVSRLSRAKSVVFTDTEHAKLAGMVTFPFADTICTPSCFNKDLGKKQVRYNGYHELAYLHPNYFKPDPSALADMGLGKNDRFIIVRFVSWGASHDVGQHGFDMETKIRLVRELEKHARVFITSESPLSQEFEMYSIKVSPANIHDLLYYATIYIGESATMATESAILGTPSVYISSLWQSMGNFKELEGKYGLIHNFTDANMAIEKAVEMLSGNNIEQEWINKRQKMLDDKIDVTQFMVDFIENYELN